MRARRLRRHLLTAGLLTGMVGFILGPATPAGAVVPNANAFVSDLTVATAGGGSGTITSSDGLINYPSDAHEAYPIVGPGLGLGGVNNLTLTAIPHPGSFFAGWELEPGSGASDLVFNGHQLRLDIPTHDLLDVFLDGYNPDDGDSLVIARFLPHHLGTLSVSKAGTGTGTVTSTDGLINCGNDCGQVYGLQNQVTLVATPGANSSFAGWSVAGDATNLIGCGGLGSCTLIVNHSSFFGLHTLVTATFNAATATVAPASESTFTHLHQHGGRVTGKVHHGVYHPRKHVHAHTHAL
jgi:hypothetical protein